MITPDEIPLWIPGRLTLDSSTLGWSDIVVKGYQYRQLDVIIPEMRDHMLVRYKGAAARMHRRQGARWCSEAVGPGVLTLLTRAEQSRWMWDRPIDVTHIYVPHEALTRIARDVFERDVSAVDMDDCVGRNDPVCERLFDAAEAELVTGGIGGRLYLQAIQQQLCVHLLRRHARISFSPGRDRGRLSGAQRRQLTEYIDAHLDRNIGLGDLAREARLSPSALARRFQTDFGCAPYAYVLSRRLEAAQRLLKHRCDLSLKEIAAEVGFADQSHMGRAFRRHLQLTPQAYRRMHAGRGCDDR